jgi:hypothetical protein
VRKRIQDGQDQLVDENTKKMYKGYILIRVNGKWVFQHRWVMEQALGRKLKRSEHVHHIGGNKENNVVENLEIVSPGLNKVRDLYCRFCPYYLQQLDNS